MRKRKMRKRDFVGGYQPIDTGEPRPQPPTTGSKVQPPENRSCCACKRMYINTNTCVICGETIPEGQQVCGKCRWYAGGDERMKIKTKICKLWEKVFSENQKKRKLLDKAKEQENKVANLIYRIKKLEEKMEGKSGSAPIYQNDEIATGNGEHRD